MTKLYTMLSSVSGAIGALALAFALCLTPQEAKAAVVAPGCTNNCKPAGNPNAVPNTCSCTGTCDPVNAGDLCSGCGSVVVINLVTRVKSCGCDCSSLVVTPV